VTHDYGADVTTAAGYLGLTFLFLIVVICLFTASQLSAAREEEALGSTEELFALPVTRIEWLGGRLGLAFGGTVALALTSAIGGWTGTLAGGAGLPVGELVLAGLNALPIAVFFLGIGTLAFALIPRETGMISFGFVALTFLLAMVGESLQAPTWVLDLSPFYHLGIVPGGSIKVIASAVLIGVGVVAGLAGMLAFARRDTVGA
jgi:ABC-2 type transport system permease protein